MNSAQVMNLGRLLTHTARWFADRPALMHGTQRWSWGEIEARVAAMTTALCATSGTHTLIFEDFFAGHTDAVRAAGRERDLGR